MIETQNTQQQVLQKQLKRDTENREATLLQLKDAQQLLLDLKLQLSVSDTELQAEKRAHQVCTERLQSAVKALSDKDELAGQMQQALTALSIRINDNSQSSNS